MLLDDRNTIFSNIICILNLFSIRWAILIYRSVNVYKSSLIRLSIERKN